MFNMFKKKERVLQTPAKSYTINVTKEGIFVDNTLVSPMTVHSLTSVFGEPRVIPPSEKSEKNYVVIWDTAGLRGFTTDINKGDINEIDLLLYDDPEWNPKYDKKTHHSRTTFLGTYLIAGKPAIQAFSEKELQKAYIFIEAKLGNWRLSFHLTEALSSQIESNRNNAVDMIRNADVPFSWAYIHYQAPRISTGKYLHKKPKGEVLMFKNLNFKLAIVEELMYNQRLLEPVFDVYDFAKDYAKRKIDIDSEGYEIIPEVKKWFKDLPVSVALAEKVKTLYLDGGNDIYLQLCPFWDGEDGMYNINAITPEELAQFSNLKQIDAPGIDLSPKVRKLLAVNGIEVNDI